MYYSMIFTNDSTEKPLIPREVGYNSFSSKIISSRIQSKYLFDLVSFE